MEIKLKEIPPKTPVSQYKAAIHRTGKIGLAIDTAKHFQLDSTRAVKLFVEEGKPDSGDFYAKIVDDKTENAYKISKAGNYHSINAKDFFDTQDFNYPAINFQYTVNKIKIGDNEFLHFKLVSNKKRVANELPF